MWNVATKDNKLVLSCHWVRNHQWCSWGQTPHDSSIEQYGTCRHAAAWHSRNDLLIISTFATDAQVQIAIFDISLNDRGVRYPGDYLRSKVSDVEVTKMWP